MNTKTNNAVYVMFNDFFSWAMNEEIAAEKPVSWTENTDDYLCGLLSPMPVTNNSIESECLKQWEDEHRAISCPTVLDDDADYDAIPYRAARSCPGNFANDTDCRRNVTIRKSMPIKKLSETDDDDMNAVGAKMYDLWNSPSPLQNSVEFNNACARMATMFDFDNDDSAKTPFSALLELMASYAEDVVTSTEETTNTEETFGLRHLFEINSAPKTEDVAPSTEETFGLRYLFDDKAPNTEDLVPSTEETFGLRRLFDINMASNPEVWAPSTEESFGLHHLFDVKKAPLFTNPLLTASDFQFCSTSFSSFFPDKPPVDSLELIQCPRTKENNETTTTTTKSADLSTTDTFYGISDMVYDTIESDTSVSSGPVPRKAKRVSIVTKPEKVFSVPSWWKVQKRNAATSPHSYTDTTTSSYPSDTVSSLYPVTSSCSTTTSCNTTTSSCDTTSSEIFTPTKCDLCRSNLLSVNDRLRQKSDLQSKVIEALVKISKLDKEIAELDDDTHA